jgi:hypothetical protein
MLKGSRKNSDGADNLRRSRGDTCAATASPQQAKCLATTGEIFEDGAILEVVSDANEYKHLGLAFWDGQKQAVSPRLERMGYIYEPSKDYETLLLQKLPKGAAPAESTRKLVGDVSTVIRGYSGLAESLATLCALFVLATWVIDAIPTAPWLSILGMETIASAQLLVILNSLCRHSLILTEVDSTGLSSLSTMWQPTLLIKQSRLSVAMQQLLVATRQRNVRIPRRGRLLDISCAVATFTEPGWASNNFSRIEIPMVASCPEPPILKASEEREITEDFQDRLLAYRFTNHCRVLNSTFDVQDFTIRMRELARSIGRCIPDDPELQGKVVRLLKTQDDQNRSERWVDMNTVIVETLLVACHAVGTKCLYIGEIAESAEVILNLRGENRKVTPREVGDRVRQLGLKTEPRDMKGFKLLLNQTLRLKVHELARVFDAPTIEAEGIGCVDCRHWKTDQ